MSELESFLQKHKQLEERSAFKSARVADSLNNLRVPYHVNGAATSNSEFPSSKVYVNPNYNRTKLCENSNTPKPSIYVNPKIIQNIVKGSALEQNSETHWKNNKHLVHVNPRLMTSLITNEKNFNISPVGMTRHHLIQSNTGPNILNNSFHDNPVLLDSRISEFDNEYQKSFNILDMTKKSPNSVLISKRKLVRLKKSPKSASISKMRPSIKRYKLKEQQEDSFVSESITPTSNIYKLDKMKFGCNKPMVYSKFRSHSTGLVSIGGVLYRTSRNRLIISKSSNLNPNEQNKFKIPIQNKKFNEASRASSISYKNNIRNKVKQKSLQILRSRTSKTNQPCLLFQRYGFCANQAKGICTKIHDQKLIQLCKNFLQGKCWLDNCPLSHNVGPEKMPTCRYFLEGCCSRNECPYLHVKVSSNNPICIEFLKGFCSRGNKCKQRHIYACPEFDKCGKCSKGKFCPYPHKTYLLIDKKRIRGPRVKTRQVTNNLQMSNKANIIENKKRYYDGADEDLNEKRDILLKMVQSVKHVHLQTEKSISNSKNMKPTFVPEVITISDDEDELEIISDKKLKRPPIGPLPSYIPIDK